MNPPLALRPNPEGVAVIGCRRQVGAERRRGLAGCQRRVELDEIVLADQADPVTRPPKEEVMVAVTPLASSVWELGSAASGSACVAQPVTARASTPNTVCFMVMPGTPPGLQGRMPCCPPGIAAALAGHNLRRRIPQETRRILRT